MASIEAKQEVEKARNQHIFSGERVQAFSDAIFAIVATFAVSCSIRQRLISLGGNSPLK